MQDVKLRLSDSRLLERIQIISLYNRDILTS